MGVLGSHLYPQGFTTGLQFIPCDLAIVLEEMAEDVAWGGKGIILARVLFELQKGYFWDSCNE